MLAINLGAARMLTSRGSESCAQRFNVSVGSQWRSIGFCPVAAFGASYPLALVLANIESAHQDGDIIREEQREDGSGADGGTDLRDVEPE